MADESFDVIVIGAGPGGYVAAIRAAQLGKTTAVVESDKAGGRCLNYACIPAKTMLHTAEVLDEARNSADIGVKVQGAELDWDALGQRRTDVSASLSGGVKGLFDKNKIRFIEGEGSLTADGDVEVGGTVYGAGKVILATGSVAQAIPGVDFSDRVLDTWGAWSLAEQPKKIAVVGAGASGSEIASAYIRYGTEVILVEMLDQILPVEDKDVVRVVERTFKKQGIEISTGTPVENVEAGKDSVRFTYGENSAEVDYLVIAGGRRPDVDALGLDAAGVKLDENGRVAVDGFQKTSNDKVYAIGDLVRGSALAHKAMEEGVVAAESAAGAETHPVDLDLVPGATFCHPQVASVGLTEAQAKEQGLDVKTGKLKLGGVGAGTVYDDRDGMVKLVVDKEYGEIVGAHIVGNRACDMIAELVAVMALEGGIQELQRIMHPHPTISEAVLDAARAVDKWATHA
ncbi:MAG TPA: dihydrolipoyl dehydrogenase [Solirubrobacterales bacterium]|jgi:dihydrolipoamide dehydrogenase|nr:dihydrolipoyl dehydrogenase [Solirubrobacterales bacterium]HMX71719.1 dihydrolipoyl dehydrogenase [Solirubrobacterales bacterium]HMY25729.1 dihydrolipoyl dehydrogenase [Solirubrobacterales bacterium]HNA23872.1 dihydrolipoyl dehydrogenase [Solirubrobacterales bacterium]HNA44571.1 dihydrolipoyl dehydrogenase [Solirubrobacterales bacterium]